MTKQTLNKLTQTTSHLILSLAILKPLQIDPENMENYDDP